MTTAYRYAQDTDVSEARSRDEIERILRRVGADAFAYAQAALAGEGVP